MLRTLFSVITLSVVSLGYTVADSTTVRDAAKNLDGDNSRGFLDIVEIDLSRSSEHLIITLEVRDPFPIRSQLLGLQVDYSFHFLNDTNSNELEIVAGLSEKGWGLQISPKSPLDNIPYSVTPQTLQIKVPNETASIFTSVNIQTTTENTPKWRPITGNPPVKIPLESFYPGQNAF